MSHSSNQVPILEIYYEKDSTMIQQHGNEKLLHGHNSRSIGTVRIDEKPITPTTTLSLILPYLDSQVTCLCPSVNAQSLGRHKRGGPDTTTSTVHQPAK